MEIVTWNTQWCCGLDGVVSPRRIVEGARQMADFDVLCLQEIADGFPALEGNTDADQSAQMEALLPGFKVFFGAAVDEFTAEGKRRRFGNLVATRLPVLQVQHQPLPYPADGGVRSMPRMCSVVTVLSPKLGAVRIMTTHLEYYSRVQRMAQAKALRELHAEVVRQSMAPPAQAADGSPFESRTYTPHAVLCGDFNLEPSDLEYPEIQAPFIAGAAQQRLWDAWHLLNAADVPRTPTFRLFDRRYGPEPVACDFVFVSESLKSHVKSMSIDLETKVSDHQPVAVSLG